MIKFQLYSLDGLKFDDEVNEVVLPTMSGEIGVLSNHMPLISVASRGVVHIRRKASDRNDQREVFGIGGGAIQIEDNTVKLLVDEADHPDEINEKEVQAAIELAKKMKAEAKDQVSLDHAQQLIDRHAVRLQVAGLKRRNRS